MAECNIPPAVLQLNANPFQVAMCPTPIVFEEKWYLCKIKGCCIRAFSGCMYSTTVILPAVPLGPNPSRPSVLVVTRRRRATSSHPVVGRATLCLPSCSLTDNKRLKSAMTASRWVAPSRHGDVSSTALASCRTSIRKSSESSTCWRCVTSPLRTLTLSCSTWRPVATTPHRKCRHKRRGEPCARMRECRMTCRRREVVSCSPNGSDDVTVTSRCTLVFPLATRVCSNRDSSFFVPRSFHIYIFLWHLLICDAIFTQFLIYKCIHRRCPCHLTRSTTR